jgi:hypothetical protein
MSGWGKRQLYPILAMPRLANACESPAFLMDFEILKMFLRIGNPYEPGFLTRLSGSGTRHFNPNKFFMRNGG